MGAVRCPAALDEEATQGVVLAAHPPRGGLVAVRSEGVHRCVEQPGGVIPEFVTVHDELGDHPVINCGIGVVAGAGDGETDDLPLLEGDEDPAVCQRGFDDGLVPGADRLVGGERCQGWCHALDPGPGPSLQTGHVDGLGGKGESHGIGSGHDRQCIRGCDGAIATTGGRTLLEVVWGSARAVNLAHL